eukprot:m.24827 g.24827  ORF g.24827 m.24827 type:complete len:137 (-) comp9137_c0_seq2:544-954(-)
MFLVFAYAGHFYSPFYPPATVQSAVVFFATLTCLIVVVVAKCHSQRQHAEQINQIERMRNRRERLEMELRNVQRRELQVNEHHAEHMEDQSDSEQDENDNDNENIDEEEDQDIEHHGHQRYADNQEHHNDHIVDVF